MLALCNRGLADHHIEDEHDWWFRITSAGLHEVEAVDLLSGSEAPVEWSLAVSMKEAVQNGEVSETTIRRWPKLRATESPPFARKTPAGGYQFNLSKAAGLPATLVRYLISVEKGADQGR